MGNMCAICFNPGKAASCSCFNLAVAVLLFAVYYGLVGGMDLYQATKSHPVLVTQKYNAIFTLSVATALLVSVVLGVLKLGIISYIFTMMVFVLQLSDAIFKLVTFILNWVDWGIALHDGTMSFQSAMVTSSISQVLTIILTFSMANILYSAAMVYKVGGNGCEYRNYKQIESSKNASSTKKEDNEAATEV
ncbi:putative transmembrane protein [Toxoplasma gondii TgCatPRC2]|uniref:Transmembrane protein n=12 Tax=Toxoplasma gondii TaxID=5811 RepID=S7W7Z9_TOXGG|nr:hypothetical protein TGGT1_309990 [Toxoplasma gondii GT1]KAF4639177.1 hypothetical protein TGRH88_049490 [Toxoplasma gondii]KFG40763.1 putative transmembrane protein [Toxoplasma gondii p89]KFG44622.1 putative transmembrane protein [Toxoplasma gondii GAB2-2007-GAL-DOM2]KFG55760.1 putative transmembrane protein [Toxoplasma gondii FOU]KFG65743.1 putative transmembrane protein [Toxoplasma gondii RUB]KFH02442.1 putative transmembrane protein [Toxoplasma gondii VAND]KFH13063.1 putative transmem